MSNQFMMVCLENLVLKNHPYRKFLSLIDLSQIKKRLEDIDSAKYVGRTGFGIVQLFKCLLLQFIEDLSDRELERYLKENTAAKLFCGFDLTDKTPHYSLFSRIRKKISTNRLSKIFSDIREDLKSKGYMSEVFTFVDSSSLISKANLWQERDKAIKKKYDKLNNEILPKVANDKHAKIGCKGKNKFWYGFKRHLSVDMQSGMINKVAITPANVSDAEGLKHICPKQGAVYGDKGYCIKPASVTIKKNGCHDATIKKNNMKAKNKDKDRWLSAIRSPYERVFSRMNKFTRYKGTAKNQFSEFMYAIAFNLKRLTVINANI